MTEGWEKRKMVLTVEQMAEACHEATRAYLAAIKATPIPSWSLTDEETKRATIAAVGKHLASGPTREHKALTPEESHEIWLNQKLEDGWKYGPVKDAERKEHPAMVPYDRLPEQEKVKDHLVTALVHTLSHFIVNVQVVE